MAQMGQVGQVGIRAQRELHIGRSHVIFRSRYYRDAGHRSPLGLHSLAPALQLNEHTY